MAAGSPDQPNSTGKQQRNDQDNRFVSASVIEVVCYDQQRDEAGENCSHPIKKLSPARCHFTLAFGGCLLMTTPQQGLRFRQSW